MVYAKVLDPNVCQVVNTFMADLIDIRSQKFADNPKWGLQVTLSCRLCRTHLQPGSGAKFGIGIDPDDLSDEFDGQGHPVIDISACKGGHTHTWDT